METKKNLVNDAVATAIRTSADTNTGVLNLRLISPRKVRGTAQRAAQTRSGEPGAKTCRRYTSPTQDLAVSCIAEIHIAVPHSSKWSAPRCVDLIGVRSAEHTAAAAYSVRVVQRNFPLLDGITAVRVP